MSEAAYFDTPERVERAQLLVHLINNTGDVLYLRGPGGAGKTRFLQQLRPDLETDYALSWHTAGEGGAIQAPGPDTPTLATDAAEPDFRAQQNERPELLIIDDADRLIPDEIRELRQAVGGRGRILLLGTGGPAQGLEGLPLQFVDLPPFSEVQTREFIQSQGKLGHGALDQKMVLSLHRAAGGQPGPLLEALAGLPPADKQAVVAKPVTKGPFSDWKWIALAGVLVTLLGAVLVFQDRINAWFVPAGEATLPEEASGVDGFRSGISEIDSGEGDREVGEGAQSPVSTPEPLPESPLAPSAEPVGAPGDTIPDLAQPATADEPADPILDAVIDAAISAAEQPPGMAPVEKPVEGFEAEQAAIVPLPEAPAATSTAGPAAPAPEPPAAAKTPPREPKSPTFATRRGGDWLQAQPGKNYTLQLVGSRDRASIDRFIRKHGLSGPHAVFSRDLDGQPWYSLVSGSYPSRDAAIAARKRLPAGLSGVWPRTFASIREQVTGR